jgi:ATP-dependent helicase/nuclease subunit B
MPTMLPRVYNIAPGGNFLEVLARKILEGFPLEPSEIRPTLSRWTILLPTRRAARQLGLILLKQSGQKAIRLPRIKPIGDLEEDQLVDADLTSALPKAMSKPGQFFALFSLLRRWSEENPLIALANEIANSPAQSIALTNSLIKLVEQFETEEMTLENLSEVYDTDLSEHRNAILSLLALVKNSLPKILIDESVIGPSERRNRLIRLEAQRIELDRSQGPIIAAGSTGTIPATRALLNAIARRPQSAVILPGLDQYMDEPTWSSLKPDHPQFALQKLLTELQINRGDVVELNSGNEQRSLLSSQLMRPTQTAHLWREELSTKKTEIISSMEDLHLVEAPDRHVEARAIALILRNLLETSGQTGALVTPDRDLALRVKIELLRWNIKIEDSAGEPLTNFGLASLLHQILETVFEDFSPSSLISLVNHSACDLGLPRDKMLKNFRHFEVAVLRNYGVGNGLENLERAFESARLSFVNLERVSPLVAKLTEQDWHAMQQLLKRISESLKPLSVKSIASFQEQLNRLLNCIGSLAPQHDMDAPENLQFASVISLVEQDAHRLPPCDILTAVMLVLNALKIETFRETSGYHPRLAIYGLLEARMIPADVLIMGGLNETKWPAQPDPSTWLNRPMRDVLGLQQPEREIGVAAHDFAQGLGYDKVYLTWSKRVDGSPLVPSRWILRLMTVLRAAGIEQDVTQISKWVSLAKAIDEPKKLSPISKPKPSPPVTARPVRISITEVEKLIRDPYSVYARKILKLDPLPPVARKPDAALRGLLFHSAINEWNEIISKSQVKNDFEILIQAGRSAFMPFLNDSEISNFWWPRFERMSRVLIKYEADFRKDLAQIHAEIIGKFEFKINGIDHTVFGRADRIDLLNDGKTRVIDYKTGAPPTAQQVTVGLSPQLTLEAAILKHGGFVDLKSLTTDSLTYIKISGGSAPVEIVSIKPTDGSTIDELAERHLAGLKTLLSNYQNENQTYLPRVAVLREENELDYDHLSRFREWMLNGGNV